jgi:hypothetical protein
MHDELIRYIRDNPDGVDSVTLARRFLKFKNPDPRLAHHALTRILSTEPRCELDDDGLWRPVTTRAGQDDRPLDALPWTAVLVLTDPTGVHPSRAVHLSGWSLSTPPRLLFSEWLIDPRGLPREEHAVLCSPHDGAYERDREEVLTEVARTLGDSLPLFLSGRQQRILAHRLSLIGESLTDDTMLASQLFRLAELPMPRPIDLESCYRTVFERTPVTTSALSHGECFAELAASLLHRLVKAGVTNRRELEEREYARTLDMSWSNKAFRPDDITSQPPLPGVYGFKDRQGAFLYIGKARNLRRRLLSYFRDTEESPAKLHALRREAYALTIHRCGSELESLVLEHRLIRKHAPRLNKQTAVDERKGTYTPIEDCIVLMPHAEDDTLMSFWFRKGQKVLLRALRADMSEFDGLGPELESFFFSPRTPVSPADFPEQEIAFRWLKRHIEQLPTVPVHRMGGIEEVLCGLRSAVGEYHERRAASRGRADRFPPSATR